VRLFDWLAPRRRCVILGCAKKPNEPSALCVDHELELSAKIRVAVARVREQQRVPRP